MTAPLPYVVIVSDGHSMRTLHRPVFGADTAQLERIIARALGPPPAAAVPAPPPPAPKPVPALATTAMMTQREIATTSGYSGNSCQTCGGFNMRRTGTCETCDGCGATSGGCS